MGAIINRELKNRIRTINGIGQHKIIVRNDLRLITKIIKKLDERWNIWESIDNNNEEKKVAIIVPSSTDDSEISSSTTTNTLIIKNKNPIGFISYNPLLKNITEYLVDEGDAEEEEELNTFEMDKELTKVIKKQNDLHFLIFCLDS
jgi:hypothetical protein